MSWILVLLWKGVVAKTLLPLVVGFLAFTVLYSVWFG
jgi:hypothetical protein